MSRPGLLFTAYRIISRSFGLVGPSFLAWRQARGKEDADRISERLGGAGLPRPAGHLAWLHGASVGEGLALLPLVPLLVERGLAVLMTTGTLTSARLLESRLPPGAVHQFVPLDVPKYARRFLSHWRPDIFLLAESELWPNLIFEASRRNIPIVLVNGRMSERSHRGWRRLPGFIGDMLGRVDLCLAQTSGDAERFTDLGAAHVLLTGNLKYDAPPPGADRQELAQLSARIGARPVWVAASTHKGEEEVIANVHRRLAASFPSLLTIIAPRHPERGREVAAMARGKGLNTALRSDRVYPDRATHLYLVDTIGELGLLYRLTGLVFMGKSLVAAGGQNPIEAAKLGCAIVHGPLIQNFGEVYRALDEAGGAVCVDGAEGLVRTLAVLFSDAARLRTMARAAAEAIETFVGATRRTMTAIEPLLSALTVEGSE
ncbi:MAG: 3-deoxy-D-manno-octulosonic acid transferase [Methylobacteriaceae bacterium]|nr:3-deoxy-D-manno-octulosonic acid transferase [Methylobacteriaceae bacterium]